MKQLQGGQNMENNSVLNLAEEPFGSIQGEGPSTGKPSVFIRFSGCNFKCSFCDTKFSWNTKSKDNYSIKMNDLIQEFLTGKFEKYSNIVITGGEPLLYQEEISEFLRELITILKFEFNKDITVEIETNGSIKMKNAFLSELIVPFGFDKNVSFNISPKLQFLFDFEKTLENFTNWEDPAYSYIDLFTAQELKLYKDGTNFTDFFENISTLNNLDMSYNLKFVDSDEDNRKFIKLVLALIDNWYNKRPPIYVMSECITREEQLERAQSTINFCTDNRLIFSSRTHILLWNKKRGV